MSHTPGPWMWQTESDFSGDPRERSWLYSENEAVLQYAGCGSHECAVSDADARLIAAAPDLLEALRNHVAPFDGDDIAEIEADYGIGTAERIAVSRAAIAKATGEPHA